MWDLREALRFAKKFIKLLVDDLLQNMLKLYQPLLLIDDNSF